MKVLKKFVPCVIALFMSHMAMAIDPLFITIGLGGSSVGTWASTSNGDDDDKENTQKEGFLLNEADIQAIRSGELTPHVRSLIGEDPRSDEEKLRILREALRL